MINLDLTHEQRLAIKRMQRALQALEEADVLICGMDNSLLYATRELCNKVEEENLSYSGEAYPLPAKVSDSPLGEECGAGKFNASCYNGSGGF